MSTMAGQIRGTSLSGRSEVLTGIDPEQYFQLRVRSASTAERGGVLIFVTVMGSFPYWT